MNKHTPWPWKAIRIRFTEWGVEAGGIIIADELTETNARLIAAAPDLLAACEKIEEWFTGHECGAPDVHGLRAAINKAKGGK